MSEEKRAMTVSTGSWPGPQNHEEEHCFHEGYLAGLTAYARAAGHSTLKRDNQLLRTLMDEQGWKTIEAFEKHAAAKPDWRIGLSCKPKYRTHALRYEQPGKIIEVLPSGTGGYTDPDGVLRIEMAGQTFLAPAGDWITA